MGINLIKNEDGEIEYAVFDKDDYEKIIEIIELVKSLNLYKKTISLENFNLNCSHSDDLKKEDSQFDYSLPAFSSRDDDFQSIHDINSNDTVNSDRNLDGPITTSYSKPVSLEVNFNENSRRYSSKVYDYKSAKEYLTVDILLEALRERDLEVLKIAGRLWKNDYFEWDESDSDALILYYLSGAIFTKGFNDFNENEKLVKMIKYALNNFHFRPEQRIELNSIKVLLEDRINGVEDLERINKAKFFNILLTGFSNHFNLDINAVIKILRIGHRELKEYRLTGNLSFMDN